jgi:Ca2+-binding RTX toxin-like protein
MTIANVGTYDLKFTVNDATSLPVGSVLNKDWHKVYSGVAHSETWLIEFADGGSYLADALPTAGDDDLEGGSGDDLIAGFDGDDILQGAGGDDSLLGGNGADTLIGGDGADYLSGGAGDDTLHGHLETSATGTAGDILEGGTGDDTLYGTAGPDTYRFSSGDGDDTIIEPSSPASGAVDRIEFIGGVSPLDVTLAKDGDDVILTYDGGSSTITIVDWYATSGHDQAIELVVFTGGAVWEQAAIEQTLASGFGGSGSISEPSLISSSQVDTEVGSYSEPARDALKVLTPLK